MIYQEVSCPINTFLHGNPWRVLQCCEKIASGHAILIFDHDSIYILIRDCSISIFVRQLLRIRDKKLDLI